MFLNALLTAALLAISTPPALAGAGATGAEFLKINPSPRAEAQGNAFLTETSDANALIQNPAGIYDLPTPEASLIHNRYLDGVDESFMAFGLPKKYINRKSRGAFGLAITYLRVADFDAYDRFNVGTGKVSATDLAVALAYADRLLTTPMINLDAGVSGKFIRSQLHDATARGTAADFGLIGRLNSTLPWVTGIRGGFSMQNIGSEIKFGQDAGRLPRVYRLGLSASPKAWDQLRIAIQRDKYIEEQAHYSVGLESRLLSIMLLRLGYHSADVDGSGLSFGMGLAPAAGRVQFDYSFTQGSEFRSIHRIGLTYRFPQRKHENDPRIEQLGEKIRVAIAAGQCFYAREYIERVRSLFPDHPLLESDKPLAKKLEDDSLGRPDYVSGYESFFLKDWLAAAQSLEKASKAEPGSEEVQEYLSLARLELEKSRKIADLEKKARISIIYDLANTARLEGDDHKALKLIEEILRQAPYPPAQQLAQAIKRQQLARSNATTIPAVAPEPTSAGVEKASSLYYSAMQKYAEGNVSEAQSLLSDALTLDSARKDIASTLERIDRELKRTRK